MGSLYTGTGRNTMCIKLKIDIVRGCEVCLLVYYSDRGSKSSADREVGEM